MEHFKDKNYYLSNFLGEVLVPCPKCYGKAKVVNDVDKNSVELFCTECGHYKKDSRTYYHLKFARNCPECGKRITLTIDKVVKKKKSMKIPCKNCGFTENYTPRHIKYDKIYGDIKKGKEPFFNIDLWLQKEYKSNLFWATNYNHLKYLKEYIQSKIRIRGNYYSNGISYYWNVTMVAKLPRFIKSGKNREGLLRIIQQLENK